MFKRVLVANRGAVAARVIRALDTLGIESVAVYSEADAEAPYLGAATKSIAIGPAQAERSYLNQDVILEAAFRSGADAIHPGYGFLSENAGFAERVGKSGIVFIGPSPQWIRLMGDKAAARRVMREHGVPLVAGEDDLGGTAAELVSAGRRVGFPLFVKATGGGGGIGIQRVDDEATLPAAVDSARRLAVRYFAEGAVYLERVVQRPRHIEFQVVADRYGSNRVLFERDCSVQRRYQKIIEEAPAPGIDRELLAHQSGTIETAMSRIGYDNLGTVEMLLDINGEFSFLEMNTRLQVEHGVTEEITGTDLVVAQIRAVAGDRLNDILPREIRCSGHAIEARVYAEDPVRFLPSPGRLDVFRPPSGDGIRIETGYAEGLTVTPFYDPMVAKVIVRALTREVARENLVAALHAFDIRGIKTNMPFLISVLTSSQFSAGDVHTLLVPELQSAATVG